MKEPISSDILSNIFDYALDGVLVFKENGKIDFINKTGLNILKESDFREKYIHQFLPDFNAEKKTLASGVTRESVVKTADGSLTPVEIRVGELSFPKEKIYFILFRDITVEKLQQKHLHMSNILLDTVTLSLADFIKNQDRKMVHEIFQSILRDVLTITQGSLGFVSMMNKGSHQVLAFFPNHYSAVYDQVLNKGGRRASDPLQGFVQEALKGRRAIIDTLNILDIGSLNALAIPLISNERTIGLFFLSSLTFEYKIETIQFLLPALQAMIVIHEAVAEREEKIRAVANLRESENKLKILVQALKLHEEELIQAKDIALASSKAKSSFLANMSHEIRTPLNVVTGMAELLTHTPLNDKQLRYVNAITSTSEILIEIVNQILDLSKIEAGELSIDMAELSLSEIIKSVLTLFYPKAKSKNLELELAFDPALLNVIYFGDALRIKQILINLVGNSLKFTEKGGIKVIVSLREHQGSKDLIKFDVIDTGIGINEETKKKLFTPFTQEDTSTTKKYGGTGLGLAICKRLVGMMQGTIDMESELGKGTAFSFFLPLEIAEHKESIKVPLSVLLFFKDYKLLQTMYRYLDYFSFSAAEAESEEAYCKILSTKKIDKVFIQGDYKEALIETALKNGADVALILSSLDNFKNADITKIELPIYPSDILEFLEKN